jgi:hypothetical protein
LLADYEEGTWNGTLTALTTAPTTPITATGRYTKIGRQVTLQISFSDVNTTGASGVMEISGMPFANSATIATGACYLIDLGADVVVAYIQPSVSGINFLKAAGAGGYLNITAGTGKYVGLTVTYST